jgi:glutamate N-acetyltransferase/amino-acid N-acetyltransferase
MATMLANLFTDIDAGAAQLRRSLGEACDSSFNCISVDGDTSTNDTLLLLASGTSGIKLSGRNRKRFSDAVTEVCGSLAGQIVADGEGVKHVIRLTVEGARTEAEAHAIANTIATSMLVKTAWAGADPNWGRILAAIGRSGVPIHPDRINIYLGDQQICRHGAACPFDADRAHQYMSEPAYDIRIALGSGDHTVTFLSCDLTTDYVHINADYST